jgi:hypothetical protein
MLFFSEKAAAAEEARRLAVEKGEEARKKAEEARHLEEELKALNEYNFKEEDRHATKALAFEEFHLEVAEKTIRVLKKFKKQTKIRPFVGGDYAAEIVDWSAVDLDVDYYTFSIQPASIFSMTPAARLETITGWKDQGIISPEEFLFYSGNPDLEKLVSPLLAGRKDIEETITMLMKAEEPGDFVPPDGYQNLQLGLDLVHKEFLKIRRLPDVPGWVLNNFDRWLGLAQSIVDQSSGADAALEASLAGMPPGPPGANPLPPEDDSQLDPMVLEAINTKAPNMTIYNGDYNEAFAGMSPGGVTQG